MSPPDPEFSIIRRAGRLARERLAEVLLLADAAATADRTYPLPEQVLLQLRHGGEPAPVQLLARDHEQRLAGLVHLDLSDPAGGATGELVVHPRHRRHGLGRRLVNAAVAVAGDTDSRHRLRLWAHGDHPGAAALAHSLGFDRIRVLHQLRRPLSEPIPAPELPAGVALRPFQPGADDQSWLAVNARAFADHPEQGRWRAPELTARLGEPWFDPEGFLLAVREPAGELLGFHWTKVHGAGNAHDPAPIGEVYVLGVDPTAHGLGLGTSLTLAGLHYLRERGLARALLFVDESNTAAMALYRKLGFDRWSADVTYAHHLD